MLSTKLQLLLLAWEIFLFMNTGSPSLTIPPGCPERCVCDDQLVVQCASQQLTSFPRKLPLTTRQLLLSNNWLIVLPALELNYLSDLVYLDCSNNDLTEVSESTFGNLQKLIYLDLSFNRISRIGDQTFVPLVSLVVLRLTNNPNLTEIHPRAFSETLNVALQVLEVSKNHLYALNISTLTALPALRSVGLSGNPWQCQCQLEGLSLWTHTETFKFQEDRQMVCDGPPALRGRRLSEVGQYLRKQCHPGLGHHDYLFFMAIGFATFAAGTVLVWSVGVVVVLCQRYHRGQNNTVEREEKVKGWREERT